MAKDPKWVISGLTEELSLIETAEIVLYKRITILLELIKNYLFQPDIESLHNVRIGIRRLRYSMELFYHCFDKKKYLTFYSEVENLQDLTGRVRDLDVFEANIIELTGNSKNKKYPGLIKQLNFNRQDLADELKLEMMKFIHGKPIKAFIKMIR